MAEQETQETRTAQPKPAVVRSLAPGDSLGRYAIVHEIGRGGMGRVYEAFDSSLQRHIALKILLDRGTPSNRERFVREAQALARLEHPNAVHVYEVGTHGDVLYIAMEFLQGGSLKDWIAAHPPGTSERLGEALQLLAEAGRGLLAAHAQGLIHRDVKPSNILIGRDGRARIADFGIVRSVEEASVHASSVTGEVDTSTARGGQSGTLTRSGVSMGTPAYMAPEQFGSGEVGAAADQFAFCVTVLETLVGTPEFRNNTVRALLASIEKDASAATPRLPAGLVRALRKGLARRPTQRHRSLLPIVEALEARANVSTGDAPPRARPWARIAAAPAVLAGLAGAVWMLWTPTSPSRASRSWASIDLAIPEPSPRPQRPPDADRPQRRERDFADAQRCPENEEGIRTCVCEMESSLRPSCEEGFQEACERLSPDAFTCLTPCGDGQCCRGECSVPPPITGDELHGSIEGQVVDEHGLPVSDARVSFVAITPRAEGFEKHTAMAHERVRTDAAGHFQLGRLAPAIYRLFAVTPRASVEAPVSVRVSPRAHHAGVTLQVVPGHRIVGRVTDVENELEDLPLLVTAKHSAGYELDVETDETGQFVLEGVHPGMWQLWAKRGASLTSAAVEVAVPMSGDQEEVSLSIESGAELRGTIRNGNGVRVSLALPGGSALFDEDFRRLVAIRGVEALVDESGSFAFDPIPPGSWRVFAMAPDGRSGDQIVTLDAGGSASIELDLQPPATLRGTVSNRGGSMQGLEARLQGDAKVETVAVSEDGSFTVDRVPPGAWKLDILQNNASVPVVSGSTRITLAAGVTATASVEIDTDSASVIGRVLDTDERPVAGALVEMRDEQRGQSLAVSNDEGWFAIPSTTSATYQLDVSGPSGLGLARVSDLRGDAEVVITLEESATLSGRVTHDGRPVRRFEVAPAGLSLSPILFCEDDGRFELRELRSGRANVAVYAPEGIAYAEIELAGGATTEFEFHVEPWASAVGRVVDADGAPLAGIKVDASSDAPRAVGAGAVRSDAEGHFELEGLGPGGTVFRLHGKGSTTRTTPHIVLPGDELDLGTITH